MGSTATPLKNFILIFLGLATLLLQAAAIPAAHAHGNQELQAQIPTNDVQAPAPSQAQTLCCRFHTVGIKPQSITFLTEFVDKEALRIRKELGLNDWGQPIDVYITGNTEDFSKATGRERSRAPWVAGIADPKLRAVALHLSHFTLSDLRNTLSHELGHIYLWERSGDKRMPRWFEEGMAMVLADEPTLEHLKQVVGSYPTSALPSLQELRHKFPRHSAGAHRAYATSHAFLTWVEQNHGGSDSFRRVIKLVALDVPFPRAFETVFGRPPEALEQKWHASLSREIWIPLALHLSDILWIFCSFLVALGAWKVWRGKKDLPGDPDEPVEDFAGIFEFDGDTSDEEFNTTSDRQSSPRFLH